MNNSRLKVCMISCLHGIYDDRIYWKEALSLHKKDYELSHICVGITAQDFMSSEGIRIIQINQPKYFNNPYKDKLFRIITFKKSIVRKIFIKAKQVHADVYHFHDYQINKIGRKLKKLPHKPKVIYDVHEPYQEIIRYLTRAKGISKLIHILYSIYNDKWQRVCAKNYDLVITTEENVANYFRKSVSHTRIKIIYNYCDFETSNFNEKIEKKYDLIYVGGISQWRGIHELMDTAILIRKARLKLKILFIGPVKERGLKDKILGTIKREKLEDIFYLKDPVDRNELIQFLKSSKIGICIFADNPVYKIILPIKIFEYMAAGLPILCNNFGHPYRIINKENIGISISEPTPKNILKIVSDLLQDKKRYNELSKNALNAIDKYSWKHMEEKLFSIYSELLKR